MRRFSIRPACRIISLVLVTGLWVGRGPEARADDATGPSVADLQQRVQELEAAVKQMQQRDLAPAPDPTIAAVAPAGVNGGQFVTAVPSGAVGAQAGADRGTTTDKNFTGWNDGFFLRSPDNTCLLRITGQLQADYRGFLNTYDTSASNAAAAGTTGSLDTFLVRRARLGIEATMYKYYEFRLLPDFAGSTINKSITDAYMNVHYWDPFQFEIGKFKQPFSYEDLIQDRYVPFMERSMMDQLVPQRDEGAMIHGENVLSGRFEYAFAVSNGNPNDSTPDDNNDKDLNARFVVRPFNAAEGSDMLRGLRIGLAGSIGVENDTISSTSSSPAILTTPATLTWFAFNSGVLANGVRHRVSPEVVYFYRSCGFAAQYFHEDLDLQASSKTKTINVGIDGYYIMASYLLTGEERIGYSQQIDPQRSFNPCEPFASPGAWEVLIRFDRLEVGSPAFTGANAVASTASTNTSDRSSNEAFETTAGLNWYLNKWVRAQFNWEHANFASPVQMGNMKRAQTEEDTLYTRFQMIF